MVVVEDVDVIQPQALQALVEAGEQVLARSQVAVGAGPHVPAGLRRNDQLVAQRREVLAEQSPEVRLGAAVGRSVVVGEVEVRHAAIERSANDGSLGIDRAVVAEVLPETEGDGGKLNTAAPTASVLHRFVAVG